MILDTSVVPLLAPTRESGEAQLQRFVPKMGRGYTNGRNYDQGAGQHRDVSMLSPYIRHRLVRKEDAIAAALSAHGPEGAEKFVQEIKWRGYFKGWTATESCGATWLVPKPGKPAWTILIAGPKNWSKRGICTTMPGCGSPRFGYSPWACHGGAVLTSSCGIC